MNRCSAVGGAVVFGGVTVVLMAASYALFGEARRLTCWPV